MHGFVKEYVFYKNGKEDSKHIYENDTSGNVLTDNWTWNFDKKVKTEKEKFAYTFNEKGLPLRRISNLYEASNVCLYYMSTQRTLKDFIIPG
jgi:hypothetical protein